MGITLANVPAPPPGLGQWMRDVVAALVQLDAHINGTGAYTNLSVQASNLSNLVSFPDTSLDPSGAGSTQPFIQATQEAQCSETVNSGSTQGVGAKMLEISGANLPTDPYNVAGNVSNWRPSIRLGVLPPYYSVAGSQYFTVIDMNAREISLRAENIVLGAPQNTSYGHPITVAPIRIDNTVGYVYLNPGTTTASGANLNLSVSGLLAVVTSMRHQKMDIEEIDPETIMGLRVVHFRERAENEPLIAAGEEPSRQIVGLIAEEVAEAAPTLALYDPVKGTPVSVEYDRVGVAVIPKVQQHDRRIMALEEQVAALQRQVEALIAKEAT
jgi:hypothetical protein